MTTEEMEKAAKAAAAEYARNWRRKNPDKWREIQNRYWLKQALKAQKQAENERGVDNT